MNSTHLSLEALDRILAFDLNEAILNNHMFDLAQKAKAQPGDAFWQKAGDIPDDIALYSRANGKLMFAQGSSGSFMDEALAQLSTGSFAIRSIEVALSRVDSLRTTLSRLHMPSHCLAFSIMTLPVHQFQAASIPDGMRIVEAPAFDATGLDLVARFSLERLDLQRSQQACRELVDSPSRRFFGLLVDGRIKAIAALTRSIGRARCLSFVYTSPQDRRQGLALLLLQGVLTACQGHHDTIFLHVEQDNEPAVSLYRSIGWETVARFAVMTVGRQST